MAATPRAQIPRLTELSLLIETARLKLRPLTEADVDAVFAVAKQREFPRYMSWAAHADREVTLEWIQQLIAGLVQNRNVCWGIELEGKLVGTIELGDVTWQLLALRVDRAELGYWLAQPHWGKGLMTEAVTAVVQFAFQTLGLHKVTTKCFVENAGSRRVMEKAGFRFVGRAEDDIWRDAAWHTHLLYELTSAEWPDVHTTMRINKPRPT